MKGTITKYRKRDGRVSWGYYYRADEKQITKSGFTTKSEAGDALEKALRGDTHQPQPAPIGIVASVSPEAAKLGDTRTLKEYIAYWIDTHAAPRCVPTTMELYRKLAAYLARHLGAIRLCDLKTAQIQETVNHLLLHGGMKTSEHPLGRPLSPKRTHAIASLLGTCLMDAVRLEHLPSSPMAGRKVKLPKRVKREPQVLGPAKILKLYEIAKGTRAYPFIVIGADSGCRRGELCALTWGDVDFTKGVITISKSLEQTKAGGLRIKSTKSGKPREIEADDEMLDVLREHREHQQQDRASFGPAYRTDLNLVFCQPNGYYWSPNNIGLRVKELMVKAGLEGFSLHSLRHSHASVALSRGVPLAVVSERLGHANQNITLSVYSHALPTDRRAAVKAWRNALADVIAEGRSKADSEARASKTQKMLGNARKLAVND